MERVWSCVRKACIAEPVLNGCVGCVACWGGQREPAGLREGFCRRHSKTLRIKNLGFLGNETPKGFSKGLLKPFRDLSEAF